MANRPLHSDLVDAIVSGVEEHGWGTVAALIVRIARPLAPALSQVVLLVAPLAPPGSRSRIDHWTNLLESPEQMEHLLQLIERPKGAVSDCNS